jgi:hypothetical protein
MRSNLNSTAVTPICALIIRTNVICNGVLRAILLAEHERQRGEEQPAMWQEKQSYLGMSMKSLYALFFGSGRDGSPGADASDAIPAAVGHASGIGRLVCNPAATGAPACFG